LSLAPRLRRLCWLGSCPRNKHAFRRRSVGCFSRRERRSYLNRYYQLRAAVTTDIGGQVVPAQKGTSPVCKEDPTCPSGGRIFNCRNDNPDICFRTEKCCTPPPPPTVCGPCQLNPATLQFTQNCTSGTNQFSISCSSCTPEAKIDLPFPISDRCVKVCCRSADLSTCSITVREC